MRNVRRGRRPLLPTAASLVVAAALSLPLALPALAAPAGPLPPASPAAAGPGGRPDRIAPADRPGVLGDGYRSSEDRAWTTSGDAAGFHVLVADAADGYRWRTAATLAEPGFEADAWIGNACVTESGDRAVVAYAPRTFTNDPELMSRGAFTAVVHLRTGEVTKLPVQASLAYFSPGCGAGERAVLAQFADESMAENSTRLIAVDAAAGRTAEPLTLDGQVTSAIPYDGDTIVAADGTRLVRIDERGRRAEIADTAATPFRLTRDAAGGIGYVDRPGRDARTGGTAGEVRFVPASAVSAAGRGGTRPEPRLVATGELTAFDLIGSASGEVYVTGEAGARGKAPAHLHNPGGLAKDAVPSTRGHAVVATGWADGGDFRSAAEDAVDVRAVTVDLTVPGTGKTARLGALPAAEPVARSAVASGRETSPALIGAGGTERGGTAASADPNDPVESERTCSVPRGDPRKQAFQPSPRQVEWAVDQAVIDGLDKWIDRPANWKNTGMEAYSPQELFPLRVLAGDPNGTVDRDDEWHIPAQILLGITAQESNMWQATRFAVPGVTANPLIGNYYGTNYASDGTQVDPWRINWADADCGYGITQVTDGMRLPGHGQPTLSEKQQEAAALDYTANIAAGADILAEKWNQTRSAGMTVNNGEPQWIENWFYALWAYNSGFYPESQADQNKGKWGVGWTNNPANPLWKANRLPFLESASGGDDYSHAAHPQDWPYQEKVLGWAGRPISALVEPGEFAAGYVGSWWNSHADRTAVKPPESLFCDASNECDPALIGPDDENDPGLGACEREDLYCWFNKSTAWKDCDLNAACGYPVHRFNNGDYPEQPDLNSYPPRCISGLPQGALIVDDLPDQAGSAGSSERQCAGFRSQGSFEFTFTEDEGQYPGKIDTHQIGAGYGNHFWFGHTRDTHDPQDTDGRRLATTGTWTLNRQLDGWARVLVHMPDHGAHTRQAAYVIEGTDSTSPVRVHPQRTRENRWVDLGVFRFTGTPKVSLGTDTADGNGSEDVAWDAVAFQPLPEKPADFVVAMGDSYSSGEGASASGGGDYLPETDWGGDQGDLRHACHRSTEAWSRQAALPGNGTSVGERVANWDETLDYHMTACSGATTDDFPVGGEGGYGELPQLAQGYLDQNTSLVMLSIGGNDARFSDIVDKCVRAFDECYRETLDGDDAPLEEAEPAYIRNQVKAAIVETLGAVRAEAPDAEVVLMGYPLLYSDSGSCLNYLGISGEEAAWMNEMGGVMNESMADAVTEANAASGETYAVFSDPTGAFEDKSICGDPEAVHGVVTDLTPGDDPMWDFGAFEGGISAQSFHPKIDGARLYANTLEQTLRERAGRAGAAGA